MQSQDPEKNEAFQFLFSCLTQLTEDVTNIPKHPDRMFHAKAIVTKILRQISSVTRLLEEIPIPLDEQGRTTSDPISVQVIVRSVLESYLIWEKIFIKSKEDYEKEFWYLAWALQSLHMRASIVPPLPEADTEQCDPITGKKTLVKAKDVHKNMKMRVAQIQETLVKNPLYLSVMSCKKKERKKRFKGYVKTGWSMSPTALLEESMKLLRSKKIYAFLCASAHLDHIEIVQIFKAKSHEEIIRNAEIAIGVVLCVLARLCKQFPKVFPAVEPLLKSMPERTIIFIGAYEVLAYPLKTTK